VRNRSICILFAVVLFAVCSCFAQQANDTIAPLRANRFYDQLYVGFDHTRTDYALAMSDGNELATTNGVDVEYDMRRKEHIAYIATVRYGNGTPFDQSLITGAAGASYLLHYRRYEPYMHAMGGYTRLASQHAAGGMYLSNVNSGFLMLFGAGLDVKLNDRWGLRALTLEDLYLPFGSARSTYWSVGSGVLYNLRRPR
jgi:opacity protein-like surface antigen